MAYSKFIVGGGRKYTSNSKHKLWPWNVLILLVSRKDTVVTESITDILISLTPYLLSYVLWKWFFTSLQYSPNHLKWTCLGFLNNSNLIWSSFNTCCLTDLQKCLSSLLFFDLCLYVVSNYSIIFLLGHSPIVGHFRLWLVCRYHKYKNSMKLNILVHKISIYIYNNLLRLKLLSKSV